MKDRIKMLRKALNLNQTDFGARIGIAQTSVANYETGRRDPTDAVILSICREFNVDETWLRTGEGSMFRPTSRDEQITAFVSEALSGTDPNFQRRLLSVLSRLSAEEWSWLEAKAREIVGE